MKQMKKSNPDWKLLSMLPLAGFLAVGMGFAAPAYAGPGQPNIFQQRLNIHTTRRIAPPVQSRIAPVQFPADLKVSLALDTSSIRKSNRLCAQGCTWDYTIRGSVKNVGRGAFVPKGPNAQALNLFGPSPGSASRARLIKSWPFGRLNPGQAKRVSVRVQRQPGPSIEFVTNYTMKIAFGPDSPGDRNRRNNQATLRRRTVVSAVNRIITVRPVAQRPGVIRTVPRLADLIPVMRGSNPFDGRFKVKNQGGATAGVSRVVIYCKKIGHRGPGTGCFKNDAMSGQVVLLPSLRAGQVYGISLPAMRRLRWASGEYVFTVKVNATNNIAESNKRNNVKTMIRRMVRRR